jgi:hypothetical protein
MAIANAVREGVVVSDEADETAEQIVETVGPVESVEFQLDIEIDLPIDELLPKYDDVTHDLPVPEEMIEASAPVSSLKEARDRRAMEQLAMSIEADATAPAEAADVEITEEHDVAVPSTPHPSQHGPSKKRHERRRVPSWDEIMFGGSTRD